jgi:hypothetical protein
MKYSFPLVPCCAVTLLAGITLSSAATLNVLPGINNTPITQVTYEVSGVDVVQTAPVPPSAGNGHGVTPGVLSNDPVVVKSIIVNHAGQLVDLNFVNSVGAVVTHINPQLASINGIGVFAHGELIPTRLTPDQTSGIPAFSSALASTFSNLNLRNFAYSDTADFRAPTDFISPTNGLTDYDVLYARPMLPTDYVFLSERNGNSSFEITALREDGTPFAEANKLRFGGAGGEPYAVYDWNSGISSAGYYVTQAQAFSVVSAKKFFEGTTETEAPIFGFRIDNHGDADVKLAIVSDTSFENRVIPEPSSFLLSLMIGLVFVLSRKRNGAAC